MTTTRRQRFVQWQAAWMLAAVVILTLLASLSLDVYFIVSLVGLLIVTELTAPFNLTPRWRKRVKVLLLLGLVGFGYLVARRILGILLPGLP